VLIKILYFAAGIERNLLLSFRRLLTQLQQNTAVSHVQGTKYGTSSYTILLDYSPYNMIT